jgi:probable HAF family extracellular repeat protein
MTKRTSQFRLKPTHAVALVALVALLVANAVTQGVLAAEYTVIDLGTLGGSQSFAWGINESGQVVGDSDTTDGAIRVFLYSGGTMTDLGSLGGAQSFSYGSAINTAGQVTGHSDTGPNTLFHAFLYSGGTMTDLGTLGGSTSGAFGINTAGQVVGHSDTPGNVARHAFRYSGGTMTDLGTLGGRDSFAYGINTAGQVVGESDTPGNGARHAFLYSNGTMTDLNDLVPAGVTVTSARGINAAGEIAAVGTTGGGSNSRALLLTQLLDRFAYAWADSPTAASYTPNSDYAYNASGGGISITREQVGIYDVAFDNLPAWGPGLSSAVAVTAYGSSPITCSVATYSSSPSRAVAKVACFNVVTQLMADSHFTIMVVGNQSLLLQSAFVMSGGPAPVPPPNPAWSWTSARNPITVTHNAAPGEYDVFLGLGNTPQSAKLVTGTTGGGTRCYQFQTVSGGLRLRCHDWTGAATDQGFSVVQVAGGRPGRRIGFAVAHRLRAASYIPGVAFNSAGGAITATRSSVGHYAMNFAGLQKLTGRTEHVQVNSNGTLSACNVVSWGNSADGLTVFVECRNGAGQFMDSQYVVLVIE